MVGSKIDLFRKEWLDVIFEKRNKSYGAYALRRQNSSSTAHALLFTSAAFILLFLSPKIIGLIKGNRTVTEERVVKQVEITIQQPLPLSAKVPLPPQVNPPASRRDQIKFAPPVVKPDPSVHDEQPPQIDDLKNADPGQKTIAGDPDGNIVIVGPAGTGPKQAAVVGDSEHLYDVINVESQPGFPGGMDKFYDYLRKAVKYPQMAAEQGIQGKVFVSFVVEKNGELTDVQIAGRKLGGGTDEEAIRVLKASPRWIPGIQNGKPVRVKYNIPISFALSQ